GSPPVQTTKRGARGPPVDGQHRATASASAPAESNLPPSGPTPTKSVSQNRQTARARSASRPLHKLQPENRQKTAGRPVWNPSPWSVRKISLTVYMGMDGWYRQDEWMGKGPRREASGARRGRRLG